jgi:hypothetical protein
VYTWQDVRTGDGSEGGRDGRCLITPRHRQQEQQLF